MSPASNFALSCGQKLAVIALAFIGLAGVVPVSLAEWDTSAACPHIGPVPVCHMVTVAYAAILLAVLHERLFRPWLFLGAWLLVFLPAAIGTSLELFGRDTCPKSADGWPKCYLSLALACAIILPAAFNLAAAHRKSAV